MYGLPEFSCFGVRCMDRDEIYDQPSEDTLWLLFMGRNFRTENSVQSDSSSGFCRFECRSSAKILLQCAGMECPCTVTHYEISAESENVVANTDKKKYTKLSKKHTCGICFRAESLECLSGGIAMIEATSCGGVVIFRGKILVLYKNYRNKYEGWVLPEKGTVEARRRV